MPIKTVKITPIETTTIAMFLPVEISATISFFLALKASSRESLTVEPESKKEMV